MSYHVLVTVARADGEGLQRNTFSMCYLPFGAFDARIFAVCRKVWVAPFPRSPMTAGRNGSSTYFTGRTERLALPYSCALVEAHDILSTRTTLFQ